MELFTLLDLFQSNDNLVIKDGEDEVFFANKDLIPMATLRREVQKYSVNHAHKCLQVVLKQPDDTTIDGGEVEIKVMIPVYIRNRELHMLNKDLSKNHATVFISDDDGTHGTIERYHVKMHIVEGGEDDAL